jgi:hypothetical protein
VETHVPERILDIPFKRLTRRSPIGGRVVSIHGVN